MKKTILTFLVLISLMSFSTSNNTKIINAMNTLYDMKEWLKSDVENKYIDSMIAETYLHNIDIILTDLKNIK
jgi:hypothetical protein